MGLVSLWHRDKGCNEGKRCLVVLQVLLPENSMTQSKSLDQAKPLWKEHMERQPYFMVFGSTPSSQPGHLGLQNWVAIRLLHQIPKGRSTFSQSQTVQYSFLSPSSIKLSIRGHSLNRVVRGPMFQTHGFVLPWPQICIMIFRRGEEQMFTGHQRY